MSEKSNSKAINKNNEKTGNQSKSMNSLEKSPSSSNQEVTVEEIPDSGSHRNAVELNQSKASETRVDSERPVKSEAPRKRKIPMSAVIQLMVAISITMLLVVLYVKFVCDGHCGKQIKNMTNVLPFFHSQEDKKSTSSQLLAALLNATLYLVVLVIMTSILVLCFYYECNKLIYCFLLFGFFLISVVVSSDLFKRFLWTFNIPFDKISVVLLIWNFAVLAILCIFWRGPLIVQQTYLILITTMPSLTLLSVFAEWTLWAILILLVIWDLIAVLCPFGPLNILAKVFAQRKKEDKNYALPPGLLYTTSVKTPREKAVKVEENRDQKGLSEERKPVESEPPRLGLGDFVFYSLLTGLASGHGDFTLIVASYTSILIGFMLTLYLLVVYRRALPALPISITLATLMFFSTKYLITPFIQSLTELSIFV